MSCIFGVDEFFGDLCSPVMVIPVDESVRTERCVGAIRAEACSSLLMLRLREE